jgi:hypothetical protein
MSYRIHPNRVSHERLGDEVIIINLDKGAYYSGSGTAADLWTVLAEGASLEQAADLLSREYGHSPAIVRADVERCVQSLIAADLIEQGGSGSASSALALPAAATRNWTAPSFDEYTDMWDLIKLDPIHDVDEAGWPHALPTSKL